MSVGNTRVGGRGYNSQHYGIGLDRAPPALMQRQPAGAAAIAAPPLLRPILTAPTSAAAADAAPPALVLIAAVARNGVIGAANALPWRLPDDMRRFRALTTGHAVIMGRRTWESLPRALPDRQNIVLSGRTGLVATGADVVSSFAAALACVRLPPPVYCIGGGEIYTLALPHADALFLTEIDADIAGDTHFPAFDRAQWQETARSERFDTDGLAHCFVTWRRVRPAPRAGVLHAS
jgi:dihydrofolate reductase